ncbi:unnamed protein product [Haemonchus placei]|uniref:Uncharacterized protein n=1 Tax=Haemonchus placei TaxID=6290 RepID=A0A0N4W8S4_HAEPC|nr:unnamed protein product [Haemonchus placei]
MTTSIIQRSRFSNSVCNVGRRLNNAGIHGRRSAIKTLIILKNSGARAEFAPSLQLTLTFCSRVPVTDESKFF